MQFSSEQRFNQSIQAGSESKSRNVSLPECTLYDAALAKYVRCDNCNISSYTDFNVTFGCYDIRDLCPPSVKRNRRLEDVKYEDKTQGELINEDENENENEDEDEDENENEDEDEDEELLSLSKRELDLHLESSSGSNDDYSSWTQIGHQNRMVRHH